LPIINCNYALHLLGPFEMVRIHQTPPRNGYYYLDIIVDRKRWKESTGTKIKRIAEAIKSKRETELNEQALSFVPQMPKITLYDALKEFIEYKSKFLKKGTIVRYIVHSNQIIPVLGEKIVSKITIKDIEDFRDSRSPSNSTINRDLEFLRNFFNWAIKKRRYAVVNPVNEVDRFKVKNIIPNALSIEECEKLLEACDEAFLKTFVMIGLHTGCRLQEILGLQWENIDFEKGTFVLTETKNNKDEIIVMSQKLANYLKSIKHDDGYVVSKSDGSKYKDVRKALERAVKKAGIKRITAHSLRHTFATILMDSGVNPRDIMELGRWSDLSLLQRYAHSSDPGKRKGVEILSDALHKKGTKVEQ